MPHFFSLEMDSLLSISFWIEQFIVVAVTCHMSYLHFKYIK